MRVVRVMEPGGVMRAHGSWLTILVALLVVGPVVGRPAGAPVAQAAAPPEALFGAAIQVMSGQTPEQAVTSLESSIGRRLAAVRVWRLWEEPFPTAYDRWLRDGGRTVFLAVKPARADGRIIRWRDLADAPAGSALDREMISWAQRVKGYGARVHLTFHHEPDVTGTQGFGTSADYIAAWRRMVSTFRAQGVTNVEWVWNLVDSSFSVNTFRRAALWYPGDAWVDAIAGDGYNWYGCLRVGEAAARWRMFSDVYQGLRLFGLAHPTKPLVIAEMGTIEDPADPGRKAEWFADAQAALESPAWSQVRAVLYFNRPDTAPTKYCRWQAKTSPSSLSAFRTLATAPHFAATTVGRADLPAATLGGRVTGPAGAAIPGATVQIVDPATARTVVQARTGSAGRYLATVRPGTYDVRVAAPDWRGLGPRLLAGRAVSGASTLHVGLARANLVTFSGTIANSAGTLLASQQVALINSAGVLAVGLSNEAGAFRVTVPAGTYRMRLRSQGFRDVMSYELAGPIALGASRWAALTLPIRTLTTRVLDPAGAPVLHASVASPDCPGTRFAVTPGVTVEGTSCAGTGMTGESGVATHRLLPTSSPVGMTVTPPQESRLASASTSVGSLSRDTSVTVRLRAR